MNPTSCPKIFLKMTDIAGGYGYPRVDEFKKKLEKLANPQIAKYLDKKTSSKIDIGVYDYLIIREAIGFSSKKIDESWGLEPFKCRQNSLMAA